MVEQLFRVNRGESREEMEVEEAAIKTLKETTFSLDGWVMNSVCAFDFSTSQSSGVLPR